ncbi:MAG TPA: formaldehyde-activating enzyme, partial [Sandaracinaceae bacterium]
EADDIYVCVGVFIHWEAKDNKKIQDYNYEATKLAIKRAVAGEPKAQEVVQKKAQVKHPFAA